MSNQHQKSFQHYPEFKRRRPIKGRWNARPSITRVLASGCESLIPYVKELRHEFIIQSNQGKIEAVEVRLIQDCNNLLNHMYRIVDYWKRGGKTKYQLQTKSKQKMKKEI